MSVPMCPVHSSPMRPGKSPGSFFCPRKNPDGNYCDQRVTAPKPQTYTAPAPVPEFAPQGAPSHKQLMALGCLDFAAKVYQGTGQSDDALNLANEAFVRWSEDLS